LTNFMEPIFELALKLPEKGSRDLLRSLHQQLRAAILEGRLQPGLRLPPTRRLAHVLGISRNTAVALYDLLLSEGYLTGRPGSGTYVADMRAELKPAGRTGPPAADDRRLADFWRRHRPESEDPPDRSFRYDFRTGYPDTTQFPADIWQRLTARATRQLARARILYGEPAGQRSLREAIAGHVSFARAVACAPEDIVVTNGARQAVDLLARILVTPGVTEVAVEDPAYLAVRNSFAAAGARLSGVPVDEEGIVADMIPKTARIICVSPSHQFPMGVVMSARRRAALLALAQESGAVIVEDDYDSEFRFGGRPLDALQTLDRTGSVFYVGTFSKSLFPSIRLGFIVCPVWAREALVAAKQVTDLYNPIVAQEALAAFIAEGHLARHIRKMRRVYRERHEALAEAIARHGGGALRPLPAAAGVHIAAELPEEIDAVAVAEAARHHDIAVSALRRYSPEGEGRNGLAFGYGLIEAADIDPAIRRLAPLLLRKRGAA
jgi:GntR family transcriptional regulator/MocR family aminotransferase